MMLVLRTFFLLLALIVLSGCEIIRVQLKNPVTTSVMLESGSLDPITDQLRAIDANLMDAKSDFKLLVTWVTSGGGIAAVLSLGGWGGYSYIKKRKKD